MNSARIPFRGMKLIACLLLCHQQSFAFNTRTPILTRFRPSHIPKTAYASIGRDGCSLRLNAVPIGSRLTGLLTRDIQRRPRWAPDWMPTWLWNLRPALQVAVLLLAYLLHISVICQHSIPFPVQLIPNERGHFQNIGLDT